MRQTRSNEAVCTAKHAETQAQIITTKFESIAYEPYSKPPVTVELILPPKDLLFERCY